LERIAAAPEDFKLFRLAEWATQFGFLVLDFGANVFRQLVEDVFALVGGEELCEIA
jgi:hypothetical protein